MSGETISSGKAFQCLITSMKNDDLCAWVGTNGVNSWLWVDSFLRIQLQFLHASPTGSLLTNPEFLKAPLIDYRVVSSLANMCVKQNALDHSTRYPNAAKVVLNSWMTWLSEERQNYSVNYMEWNASEPSVLQHIPLGLQDALSLSDPDETLGIEWNSTHDQFRLIVADLPHNDGFTLVSDIARCLRLVFANNCECSCNYCAWSEKAWFLNI